MGDMRLPKLPRWFGTAILVALATGLLVAIVQNVPLPTLESRVFVVGLWLIATLAILAAAILWPGMKVSDLPAKAVVVEFVLTVQLVVALDMIARSLGIDPTDNGARAVVTALTTGTAVSVAGLIAIIIAKRRRSVTVN